MDCNPSELGGVLMIAGLAMLGYAVYASSHHPSVPTPIATVKTPNGTMPVATTHAPTAPPSGVAVTDAVVGLFGRDNAQETYTPPADSGSTDSGPLDSGIPSINNDWWTAIQAALTVGNPATTQPATNIVYAGSFDNSGNA